MKYQSMQLFIEEPEQNLYPDAQRMLIQNLVRRVKNASLEGKHKSMIVMTTHSPYVLSTLNVLMADSAAKEKFVGNKQIDEIIDNTTLLSLNAYSAYYIDAFGIFKNIKDTELSMFSGIDLDQVSDWVDEHIYELNKIIYRS